MIDSEEKNSGVPPNAQQSIDITKELEVLLNLLAESTKLIQAGGTQINRLAAQKLAVESCKAFIQMLSPARERDLWLPLQMLSDNLMDVWRGITPEDFEPITLPMDEDGISRRPSANKGTTQSDNLRFHCAACMQLYIDGGMSQTDAADRVAYKMRIIPNLTATRVREWRNRYVARTAASEGHSLAYHQIISALRRRSGGVKPDHGRIDDVLGLLAIEFQGVRLKSVREQR